MNTIGFVPILLLTQIFSQIDNSETTTLSPILKLKESDLNKNLQDYTLGLPILVILKHIIHLVFF